MNTTHQAAPDLDDVRKWIKWMNAERPVTPREINEFTEWAHEHHAWLTSAEGLATVRRLRAQMKLGE